MPRSVEIVLSEMLDAIDGITHAVEGKSFDEFERDWILRLAIERALEIVSEGSRHIPRHEYHKVAPAIIWAVVMRDIAASRLALLRIRDREA